MLYNVTEQAGQREISPFEAKPKNSSSPLENHLEIEANRAVNLQVDILPATPAFKLEGGQIWEHIDLKKQE